MNGTQWVALVIGAASLLALLKGILLPVLLPLLGLFIAFKLFRYGSKKP